jgi:UDP-N-acetyl-D-galactosamine dehydrogenase
MSSFEKSGSATIKNVVGNGNIKLAIIGLGYVGLPLAIEFAKKYNVLGFDIDSERISELLSGLDRTREADICELNRLLIPTAIYPTGLYLSSDKSILKNYNVFIVTVPTPVNQFKSPNLTHLLNASAMLGEALKKNDVIIYESTVYPGCTEEDCVPVLESSSGLKFNIDFFVGYSPERINPGDKINTLTSIKKVTSGSTPTVADFVDDLYKSIIKAGTHKAPSLKVAEASKAIENTQRDINISFINELALIFDRMGIDTNDVLDAAGTKWNFLKYKPGLVGGHCIGVDPYYLAYKAEELGYYPHVILSGRRVNDNMGIFVANKIIKLLIQKGHKIAGAKVLILGIAFKENCPDIRNTKAVDVYHELKQFEIDVDIYDPWASFKEVKNEHGLELLDELNQEGIYDAIIVTIGHNEFLNMDYSRLRRANGIIFDIKGCLDRSLVDGRL